MVSEPSGERIGWWPSGERSRIESRVWPSATRPPGRTHTPLSSGPRCLRLSTEAARSASHADESPRRAQYPVIPHMSGSPSHATRLVVRDLAARVHAEHHSDGEPEKALLRDGREAAADE